MVVELVEIAFIAAMTGVTAAGVTIRRVVRGLAMRRAERSLDVQRDVAPYRSPSSYVADEAVRKRKVHRSVPRRATSDDDVARWPRGLR